MKFLLEGTTWPGRTLEAEPTPPQAEPAQAVTAKPLDEMLTVPVVKWIAETADYGITITALKNEQMPSGEQDVYAVWHKRHRVLANQFRDLPSALTYIQGIQEALDQCLGKNMKAN